MRGNLDDNDAPVCPYCGHVYQNAWEIEDEDSTLECDECLKEYLCSRTVSVAYSTKEADWL